MYLNSEYYLDENLYMYIAKYKSTESTCSDKLFKSDSMRLLQSQLIIHFTIKQTRHLSFIICHRDFIIKLFIDKLSPLSNDPSFTCKNYLPLVMSLFLLVTWRFYNKKNLYKIISPE